MTIREIEQQCDDVYNDMDVIEMSQAHLLAFTDCYCKHCEKCTMGNNCMLSKLLDGKVNIFGEII